MTNSFPPAAGTRLAWGELPVRLRDAIERALGEPILSASASHGGFSPAFAGAVTCESGRSVFVKATGSSLNSDSPVIYAREAIIAAALPPSVCAPRLHETVEMDGWIALVFDLVAGHNPALPWRDADLERVIDALQYQFEVLTPSPVDVAPAAAHFASTLNGFGRLRMCAPPGLDAWSRRHLDRLADLEARAPDASRGDTLLHLDLRADNIVLTPDKVFVVDWPSVATGARWVDVLAMAPSVAMQGGPSPERFLAGFPAVSQVDPAAINEVLATIAGYFTHRAFQPPPPGLPTLRVFQAAQGEVARGWLAQRLGW